MKKKQSSPFEIVANVLDIDVAKLNVKSAMGETPNWDSLKHVELIGELESIYKMQISNEDIEKYVTIKAIIELHNEVKANSSLLKRFKDLLKRNSIGKIFIK